MNSAHARRLVPSLSALQAFEAAARHGSFTRAAEELDLTQGAVSRQVATLEDSLGVTLFERVRQRVALTPAGTAYADEIREALGRIAAATLSAMTLRGAGGTLGLAILPTFGTRWLIPRLPGFFRAHPEVTITFATRIVPFDFAADGLDAAIHFGDPVWPGAAMHPLMGETIVPVASPSLLAETPLREPEDVLKIPLLQQATRPRAWPEWLQAQGVSPGRATMGPTFEQFAMVARAAAAGLGLAVVPRFLVEEELRAGQLVIPFDRPITSRQSYWLVYPREKDPTYQFSSSALSAASIRQQYSSAVNIRISLFGIRFLREIGERLAVGDDRPAIDLHEGGYLYLGSPGEGAQVLRENNALQTAEGADIAILDKAALAARFPFLSLDGIELGSYGVSGEGWFDGWGLMQALRKKARSLGVTYMQGEVVDVEREGGRVTAVRLADGQRIACGALVNAAGASGARVLAEKAGVAIPVYPHKRCVFTFHCKGDVARAPLLIDVSGAWCRPEGRPGAEGQMFLCGGGPMRDETEDTADFEVEWNLFEEHYWPTLAERIPAFEQIRPGRAWAGHYDMNRLDHNGIVGQAGECSNFYVATGFSGHGLQQAPAVGRGIAELIVHGGYKTLDLSDLGFERIAANRPLLERNVI